MRIPSIQLKAAAFGADAEGQARMARLKIPECAGAFARRSADPAKIRPPPPDPLFARDFFNLLDSAELSQRCVARFVGQHSRRNISLDQKIEMRLHFFRHLGVPFVFLKQTEQAREPGAKLRHICYPPARTRSIPL